MNTHKNNLNLRIYLDYLIVIPHSLRHIFHLKDLSTESHLRYSTSICYILHPIKYTDSLRCTIFYFPMSMHFRPNTHVNHYEN